MRAEGCGVPPGRTRSNPASLRAYARLGTSTFISWVDAAEKAVADSVQTSSLPKHNLCEGFAAMHLEFGRPLGAHAQAIIDAADDAEAAEGGSWPARAHMFLECF